MELKDAVVIVTGGARGIGFAITRQLQSEGSRVAVLDRDAEALSSLEALGQGVSGFRCDILNPAEIEASLQLIEERLGKIHVLVNNAGVIHSEPLVSFGMSGVQRHSDESWDRIVGVNLTTVFRITSRVVERFLKQRTRGVIANISSISAAGNPGQSAYSAAKAGVDALTVTWARELGPMGIRVVGIAPGFTDTRSAHAAMSEAGMKAILSRVPVRRLGTPEEIARGVLDVIRNDFFNGSILHLDGGLTL